MSMYLDEIFLSIQGESTDTGLPCIFIRLFGCPIGCVYCDQYQDPTKKKKVSLENLVARVKKFKGAKRVCITGGEPLIYEEVIPLTQELMYNGYEVSIETSGCIPIPDVGYRRSFKYIMDVKCPSSGVSEKNIYDNLLRLQFNDEVVCVIKDRKDYDFMKRVLNKYPTQAHILLSPMFDSDGKALIGSDLVNWVLKDKLDYRIQIQLHKILGVH
jgi:7-carboxy-7-deazaguanine synthase